MAAMDIHQRDDLAFPQSLPEFQRLFPDDAAGAAYLGRARWPDGFVCPHCGLVAEPTRQGDWAFYGDGPALRRLERRHSAEAPTRSQRERLNPKDKKCHLVRRTEVAAAKQIAVAN